MKKKISFYLMIVLVVIFVLFAVTNAQDTVVNFLFAQVKLPLVIVLIASVLIGALIASLFFYFRSRADKKEIKTLKEQLAFKRKTHYDLELQEKIVKLEEELTTKSAELSNLKHSIVSQVMSDSPTYYADETEYQERKESENEIESI